MIIQPKALWGPVQLVLAGGGPSALIYTAPSLNSPTLITSSEICNTDSTLRTYSIYVVRSGGSLSNANAIILVKPIAADASYVVAELAGLVLNPGDTIWANADLASKINFIGSGWGI